MATPITWQNINAPSLADASRPLEAAQRSLGGMFDQLSGLVKGREQIDAQNWTAGRNNNTNAFLDRLAQYRSPQELAAAQQSGELAQLRAQFGNQIDSTAIRGAEEQRVNALRTGAKQEGEYQDWNMDRGQKIIVDDIRQTMLTNPALARRMLQENGNLFRGTDLARELDSREQEVKGRDRGDTEFGWKGQKFDLEMLVGKDNLATNAQQRSAAREQILAARSNREQQDDLRSERAEEKRAQQAANRLASEKANNIFGEGSLNPAKNLGEVLAFVNDPALNLNGDERENMIRELSNMGNFKVKHKGKDLEMPYALSEIKAAVLASAPQNFNWTDQGRADDLVKTLKERMKRPEVVEDYVKLYGNTQETIDNPVAIKLPPLKKPRK